MSGAAGPRVFMSADAVGGVWTYALDLARGLSGRGVKTALAVLGPAPAPDQSRAAAAIPRLDVIETGLPLDWTADDPDEIETAGARLAALARDWGADLVHLNSPALAAGGGFTQPVIGVCHSCLATWWAAVRGTDLPPDFAWRTDILAAGYAQADALIAPSRAFAQATAVRYGIPTPVVVHNGREAGPDLRSEDDATFVFTAGRLWDEGKNIAALDRAAEGLGVPVRAAGPVEGPNGAAIAIHHVAALGRLSAEAVAQQLRRRPIYCTPALYEPFGLAVLEAAQVGCPLVLADIPSFREIWGEAALFVPPRDAGALAATLRLLADDPAERRRLGIAAQQRANAYSCDAMVDGTLAIYRTVLARAPVTALEAVS